MFAQEQHNTHSGELYSSPLLDILVIESVDTRTILADRPDIIIATPSKILSFLQSKVV
jgi:hypothetical protein